MLAVLGRGIVPLSTPVIRADDLGATRGDGVFETMHVRYGKAWLRDEHLARMARSATILALDLPHVTELAALLDSALAAWPRDRPGGVKLVCTRGPEGHDRTAGGPATVFAMVFDISPGLLRQRREGVRTATATLGISADVRAEAPWLLGGVKSLSYAVNMAAQRWANDRGLDDVVLLSSEGQVLEAPTSTVVWASGGALRTVPNDTGILAGTTAAYLLDHAAEAGLRADRRRATVDDLYAADGVWLCSSVRGPARVVELDGKTLTADAELTAAIPAILGFDS